MGTEGLKFLLDTYLDEEINVEVAFYTFYQQFPNHYWTTYYK